MGQAKRDREEAKRVGMGLREKARRKKGSAGVLADEAQQWEKRKKAAWGLEESRRAERGRKRPAREEQSRHVGGFQVVQAQPEAR